MPSQNTACFTDRNQFEGAISFGLAGGNVNLSYSPLKHLALHCNAYSSLNSNHSSTFNNQLEAAIGTYLPLRLVIFGLNAGYGQGSVVWYRWYAADSQKEEADHAEFDTKRIFSNLYLAYKFPRKEHFTGLSFKVSYLEELYYYQSTDFWGKYKQGHYGRNFKEQETCYELSYFLKLKINKSLFFTNELGLQISSYPRLIARVGLLFKI